MGKPRLKCDGNRLRKLPVFHKSDCDVIIRALPTTDLPIILEVGTGAMSSGEIKAEYDYVRDRINRYIKK